MKFHFMTWAFTLLTFASTSLRASDSSSVPFDIRYPEIHPDSEALSLYLDPVHVEDVKTSLHSSVELLEAIDTLVNYYGHFETVRIVKAVLVQRKISLHGTRQACRDGYTALHLAVLRGNLKVVKVLLEIEQEKWALLSCKTKAHGETAFHLAVARNKSTEIAIFLLDTADAIEKGKAWDLIRMSNKKGFSALTPFMYCLDVEKLKIMEQYCTDANNFELQLSKYALGSGI